MNIRLILFLISLIGLTFFVSPAVIADNNLYSTDFSDAQGWSTNSNNSYYLDGASGRYHYLIEGGTGSYASFPLQKPLSGPFKLEFDVYPVDTEGQSSFRFGIGTETLDSQKGPLVMAELNNQNEDNAFSLVAISEENLRSQTFSIPGKANYSGKTVKFIDGGEYHIRLTWYPAEKRVSMTVSKPGEEMPIFSHFVTVSGKIEGLTHLFMTSVGEGQSGMKAEGFIDNISLTSLSNLPTTTETTAPPVEITPTPTLVIENTEEPVESIIPEETIAIRTPLPTPPTPTPTQKSGFFPFVALVSVFLVLIMSGRKG